jgi:hypothetical protein
MRVRLVKVNVEAWSVHPVRESDIMADLPGEVVEIDATTYRYWVAVMGQFLLMQDDMDDKAKGGSQ